MAKTSNPTPALVNSVDLRGRPIEPGVLSAANEIAPKALLYAEKVVADSCVAINLLEEAAATVSEAVHAKEAAQAPPIRDMRAYVYRAFLHRRILGWETGIEPATFGATVRRSTS